MNVQSSGTSVTPMKVSGVKHHVDRVYREGGEHQWVRETLVNSIEAGASRIEFGIEWQAVRELGVYRRLIVDNGEGMTPEQLVGFFNVWGGGGKPIGGLHENFGIGAKSSLLPWNRYGLVVVSWVDGEAAMIWVMADPATGEYGLRNFEAVDADSGEVRIEEVVTPFFDEEHGCDWASVKPDWIEGHGTAIVLLGDEPIAATVLGDPNRPGEADIKGVSTYLNRRIWDLADSTEITVDELRQSDPKTWPVSEEMAHVSGGGDRRTNRRRIEGAKFYIEYPKKEFKRGRLGASGSKELADGTFVDWYLWDGDRPGIQSYAAQGGYIAALYGHELYDVTNHHSTYRSFGVLESSVRSKLWLILRPPAFDEKGSKRGVYPRGDRNSLLVMGGPHAGEPLPINDWGAELAEDMPAEIRDAIRAARAGGSGTIADESWKERLAERFGSRWRMFKLRARKGGPLKLNPDQAGSMPRAVKRSSGANRQGGGKAGGTGGDRNTGSSSGTISAARVQVGGGIPTWVSVRADDLDQGMLAAWAPNHPEHPEGAVLINIDHPVMEEEVAYWQSQYGDHLADQVGEEVIATYGEIAVAKVAHSEHLKSILPSSAVEQDLRSEAALTMALLGLIGEEAVIAPRIGGKFGRRAV
ncbi:MAG TPA: hypothetical protein VGI17_14715 [Solirubrobacterales bacterium]|jgi:hypothetical protein